jgi:hypothetical protein
MSTALKLRRGTTAQHSTFTGAEGEVTVDTTKDTVVVHDGSTAGGFPLLRENNPNYTGTLTGPTINLSQGQIVFPATQNASSNANTLDDYEEGTFSPEIWVGSTQQSLSRVEGAYVKIGQLVLVQIATIISGAVSGSGAVEIRNLPFVVGSYGPTNNARAAGSIGFTNGAIMPTGVLTNQNTTRAAFFSGSPAGTSGAIGTDLQGAALPSDWNIHVSIVYRT